MKKSSKPFRIPDLQARKQQGSKITMVTAYDAWLARLLAESGVIDILLVGDSLGMVQLGYDTTVPVTMTDMLRHSRSVRRGAPDALIITDLPFLSGHVSPEEALRNAGRLIQRGGATGVKIEGGIAVLSAVERMVAASIPVMGHLGLQPQSVHALGGFRRQAKTHEEQERVVAEGLALETAGVCAIVLEYVPEELGLALTKALSIPVIGIGAGPDCDGQVLVTHDILGLTGPHVPGFAKRYVDGERQVVQALRTFSEEVHAGRFPTRAGERSLPVVQRIDQLQTAVHQARRAGRTIGFVPTMGALHAGHAKLLAEARQQNDIVVVSIFVNPLQFERQEDLEKYPRTWDADLAICREHEVDLVFAPQVADLYPAEQLTVVDSPSLSRFLCGAHRPGHFRGVATVVLKLFNLVQPDRAYFGEKDAQQLVLLRRMVKDLNVPVEIVPVATVREHDGLALSSRNKHLTNGQRSIASVLYRSLQKALELLQSGQSSVASMRRDIEEMFNAEPEVRLEYFDWVDPETLTPVEQVTGPVLIAAAMWLGTTRLIDNVRWPA